MATTTFQLNYDVFAGVRRFRRRITARGLWLGLILLAALVAFELFNFATTEYALQTLFGPRDALGLATWATVLAIAFCGIDFAGLSRLFTPETGRKEPKEIWLLTGAWFLGAGMNAIMTWWAVASALSANAVLGNELVTRAEVLRVGPVVIAGLVWLTRVLIIGTFAFAGDHLFTTAGRDGSGYERPARPVGDGRYGGSSRMTVTPAEPRAVPKPQPVRSLPLASSSYGGRGDEGDGARYGTARNFFGSGTGHATNDGAARFTAAGPEPVAQAPEPVRPASPRSEAERVPLPLNRPAAAAPEAAPRPASFERPAAFNGPSGRASTTRTITPPAASAPVARRAPEPEPVAMELEYVDLD